MHHRKIVVDSTTKAIWYAQEDAQEVVRSVADIMGMKIGNAKASRFESVTLFRSNRSSKPHTSNGSNQPADDAQPDYYVAGNWNSNHLTKSMPEILSEEDLDMSSRGPTLNKNGDYLIPLDTPTDTNNASNRIGILKIKLQPQLLPRFSVPRSVQRLIIPLTQSVQTMISAERYREIGALQRHRELSGDIHDHISQAFYTILWRVAELRDSSRSENEKHINIIEQAATTGSEEATRIRAGDVPQEVREHGLRAALARLAHKYSTQTPMIVYLTADGWVRSVSERVQGNLYSIVHEALNNSQIHGGATKVRLKLDYGEQHLLVRLQDNGCGFEPEEPQDTSIDAHATPTDKYVEHGIAGMSRRAEQLGGSLHLSSKPKNGTTIIAVIPVN